jgi:hypothetical protein
MNSSTTRAERHGVDDGLKVRRLSIAPGPP